MAAPKPIVGREKVTMRGASTDQEGGRRLGRREREELLNRREREKKLGSPLSSEDRGDHLRANRVEDPAGCEGEGHHGPTRGGDPWA